jgi:N-acetylglutamate synthase-like GNAT family acetyltransferase
VTFRIRRARLDEIDVLTKLSLRSKQSNGYDDAFMEACREELTVTEERMQCGEYWVAESDRVRGCACLVADLSKRTGEVHAFFIDPDNQRQGIGRMLWQKLVERAKQEGLMSLHLDADPFAVPFYEALGFKSVGMSPSGSIEGRSIPYMTISFPMA